MGVPDTVYKRKKRGLNCVDPRHESQCSPRNLDSHGMKKVPCATTDSFAIKWALDWLTLPPGGLVRVRILRQMEYTCEARGDLPLHVMYCDICTFFLALPSDSICFKKSSDLSAQTPQSSLSLDLITCAWPAIRIVRYILTQG